MDIFPAVDRSGVPVVIHTEHFVVPGHCERVDAGFPPDFNTKCGFIFFHILWNRASDFSLSFQLDFSLISVPTVPVEVGVCDKSGLVGGLQCLRI